MVNKCCFGNPRQCWILDSHRGSRITGTGFRISFVCRIPDSLICIPDSKGQDSIFHSKNLLDSVFFFSGTWIPDSHRGSRITGTGFRISFVWGLPDFLIFIPGFLRPGFHIRSKNLMDSGFHGQKFPGFGNPDSLIWVRCCWSPPCTSAVFWFPKKLQGEKL